MSAAVETGFASLGGKTALVTGGGSGIGRATALLCARLGAAVAVVDVDDGAARAVAGEIAAAGGDALAIAADVREEAAVEQAFAACAQRLGVPGAVVANAAVETAAAVAELTLAEWERTLAVNLTGTFLTCRAAVRSARAAQARLALVCVSSPAAFAGFGEGGAVAYSASKGGLSAFTRALAIECAGDRIRVNAVVPGVTETPLAWGKLPPAEVERMRARLAGEVPLGRIAEPEEPAQAIAWLLSDAAGYVTGAHLVCDGGILAKAAISA